MFIHICRIWLIDQEPLAAPEESSLHLVAMAVYCDVAGSFILDVLPQLSAHTGLDL